MYFYNASPTFVKYLLDLNSTISLDKYNLCLVQNLSIKMRSAGEMDQADAELRATICKVMTSLVITLQMVALSSVSSLVITLQMVALSSVSSLVTTLQMVALSSASAWSISPALRIFMLRF